MNKRLLVLILVVSMLHFSLSVILFIFFGLGLEDRSIGSDLFWYLQEPIVTLIKNGFFPDLNFFAFPMNSLIWGCIISGVFFLLKHK